MFDEETSSEVEGFSWNMKVFLPNCQFNAGPLFAYNNDLTRTDLNKIEPNTGAVKFYNDLPDVLDSSLYLILNNDEEETKYENVIHINSIRAGEKSAKEEGKKKKTQ